MSGYPNEQAIGTFHYSNVRKMGATYRRPEEATAQALANAMDAHARAFRVEFDKKSGVVRFVDDGDGMDLDAVNRFVGMGDPHKAGSDALGANGTGKTSFFVGFQRITVWTAVAGEPFERHFSFTDEESAVSMVEKAPVEVTRTAKGARHTRCGDHGTVIELSQPRAGKTPFTPGRLTRYLPRFIAPWDFDKVLVDGKKLAPGHPLGECFNTGEDGVLIDGVGQVVVIAGVSDKRAAGTFRSWGSWGHVCTQEELRQDLPDKLAAAIPPEWDHPNVWYYIRVRAWKDFEAEQTRDGYEQTLFQSQLFGKVVLWLRQSVLPVVRQKLGSDAPVNPDIDEAIDRVTKRFIASLGGARPEADKTRPGGSRSQAVRIVPQDVELLVSQEFTFDLEHVPEGAQVEVDARESGGSVWDGHAWVDTFTSRKTRQIRYRAGMIHGSRFRLFVTIRPKDGDHIVLIASPALVTEHRFSISPRRLKVNPGESVRNRLKLVNAQGLSDFRWECEGANLEVDKDGLSAVPTAGSASGSFRIACTGTDNRGREQIAEATLVVRELEPAKDGDGVTTNRIYIGEIYFLIFNLPGGSLVSTFTGGDREQIIYMNPDHPAAQAAQVAGKLDELVFEEALFWMAATVAARDEAVEVPRPLDITDHRSQLRLKLTQS